MSIWEFSLVFLGQFCSQLLISPKLIKCRINMSKEWTEAAIQLYITDEIEESLTLDYKAADALDKTDGKKKEITKDVSAMANSAGGIIIYGLKEYTDPAKKHFVENIDPIDRT